MNNVFATKRRQMRRCEIGTALVIRQQRMRIIFISMSEHINHRQAMSEAAIRCTVISTPRSNHEAINALAQKLIKMLALTLWVVGGVAHEHRNALCGQAFFQGFKYRKTEPTKAVIRDHTNRHRLGAM